MTNESVYLLCLVGSIWMAVVLTLALKADATYRPILVAYLEARAAAAGKPMRVAEANPTPGRLFAPLPPPEYSDMHEDDVL